MAACGSLQPIFEKPLPENPTLIESLSQWNLHQMKTRNPLDLSSFNEIFGELHFQEKNKNPNSDPSPLIEDKGGNANDEKENDNDDEGNLSLSSSIWSSSLDNHNQFEGFCYKNSESLQLCTEGLGSESADDVEDSDPNNANCNRVIFYDSNKREDEKEAASITEHSLVDNNSTNPLLPCLESNSGSRRFIPRTTASSGASSFPPPISCIGRGGKPWVYFRSYRHDGRFVLKEMRIPTHEFLSACREDGRLRLQFVQPDEEIPEEEEEEEEEVEEEEVVDGKGGSAG